MIGEVSEIRMLLFLTRSIIMDKIIKIRLVWKNVYLDSRTGAGSATCRQLSVPPQDWTLKASEGIPKPSVKNKNHPNRLKVKKMT